VGSSLTFVPQDAVDINTADKLFEYFLIDVETQPPVETSRIRLALSSVQLFIERILRNLEPSCAPSDVEDPNKTPQWPWMKRYRVWQANREVFLWPENWTYPELRDDQSPFFKEMMSALLQSDITDDAAATAYLDYLTKLEEVAKLEPCGLYYTPKEGDANEAAYVVARTAGALRKHYFRQLQNGSWMPWTEVKIDCEDMPLTPIVWNGRLFLFWLKKVVKGNEASSVPPDQDPPKALINLTLKDLHGIEEKMKSIPITAILCWSELYNDKWQPTKTSDMHNPTTLGIFDIADFDADRNLWRIVPVTLYDLSQKRPPFTLPPDALVLAIRSGRNHPELLEPSGPGFILYNTHSQPLRADNITIEFDRGDEGPLLKFSITPFPIRALDPSVSYTGTLKGTFQITYQTDFITKVPRSILDFSRVPRYVEPQPGLLDAWKAPFFFEDRRCIFYVTTKSPTSTMQAHTDFGILSARHSLRRSPPHFPPLIQQQAKLSGGFTNHAAERCLPLRIRHRRNAPKRRVWRCGRSI
jgi:hypothetical protein